MPPETFLPSGATRTLLTGSGVISWQPDWSPSGTRHLVATDHSGTTVIEEISKLSVYGFSRDGRQAIGILQNTTGDGEQWQLYAVDVAT